MKLLILGGNGMLGHMLADVASLNSNISVTATTRGRLGENTRNDKVSNATFDAHNLTHDTIEFLFGQRFDYCVNCIGAVKQKNHITDFDMTYLNAVFPSLLANICKLYQTRLIHLSTDCVFDGERGNYSEAEAPNAYDTYGYSKFLGEQISDTSLVFRTSIVGPELNGSNRGLLEWFLAESGAVTGYTQAYFSGVTTLRLSEFIVDLLEQDRWESGLFQLAGPKISKFDLLQLFRKHFGLNTTINRDAALKIDRSLINSRIARLGYVTQSWEEMLRSLTLCINNQKKIQ